eukprot:10213180-Heterocapsa_arctica.AAC.1
MLTDEQTNRSFFDVHKSLLKAMIKAKQVHAAKRDNRQHNKATVQYIPVEPALARENNVVPDSNSRHQHHI